MTSIQKRLWFQCVNCVCFLLFLPTFAEGPPEPEAPVDQLVEMEQLAGKVELVTDAGGVVHILASHDSDAFFAQGWIHARDRFFQMDHDRRLYSGALAELLGPDLLDSDIQFRTLGIRRAAERSWEAYSPRFRRILEAYSSGVNAYLQDARFELPSEYEELELTSVEEWTPLDSVTISKGIVFGLSFDLDDLTRTEMLEEYREAGDRSGFDGEALFFEDLMRRAPFDSSITIQEGDSLTARTGRASRGFPVRRLESKSRKLVSRYLERVREIPYLRQFLHRQESRGGSNFWAVSGALSESGFPMLANDPHQSLTAPGVFYEVHILVRSDPARGRMNVSGVSFPGVPGVAQGCNEDICWGSTLNPLDVTDAFEESLAVTLLPLALLGTRFEGELEFFETIEQVYRVNQIGNGVEDDLQTRSVGDDEGGITYVSPRRNYGPLVAVDRSDLFDIRGITIQYAGFSPTRELEATFLATRARNVFEFREALQFFDVGSQNWVCADREGNIAYFSSGEAPLREDLEMGVVEGTPPYMVRDGTHGFRNEWIPEAPSPTAQALPYGILPYEEMPQVVNPEWGYLANGNSDPLGVTLDNNSLNQFRPGGGIFYLNAGYVSIRMGRIQEMLDAVPASGRKFTLEDLKGMQADNQLVDARVFVPHILSAFENAGTSPVEALSSLGEDPGVAEAVGRLEAWDFSTPAGLTGGGAEVTEGEATASVAATIYAVWRSRFIANTIDRALERQELQAYRPDSERTLSALRFLLEGFDQNGGIGASGVNFFLVEGIEDAAAARDVLLLRSLQEALEALLGGFQGAFEGVSELSELRWGRLHRVRFAHPLGGAFSIPPAGPFADLSAELPGIPRAGGYESVDEASHSARAWGANGFMSGHGPARRFVAELRPSGIEAYQVVPPGPGGDRLSEDYASQLEAWLENEYHPVLLSESSVESQAVEREVMAPSKLRFYFPYYQGDASTFTAFATANLTSQAIELEFLGWSPGGELLPFSSNPAPLTLLPGEQSARLGNEILGAGLRETQAGWLEINVTADLEESSGPPLAGFTQFGNFSLSLLDGGVAFESVSRELYFSRIFEGASSFRGAPAETTLYVANPGEESLSLRLSLFAPSSAAARSRSTGNLEPLEVHEFQLGAKGLLGGTVSELFNLTGEISGGYVRVDVTEGAGAVGFETIALGEGNTVVGLNASFGAGTGLAHSAQLASSLGIFTSIQLINTSVFERTVRLQAIDPDAARSPKEVRLEPFEVREVDAAELFTSSEAEQLQDQLRIASLEVSSDGTGIIGDVIFGDPQNLRFAAALPLQSLRFREAVFGHVANLGDFFTGLAVFNPDESDAEITIEVFAVDGSAVGEAEISLKAGERTARTLVELVPLAGGQAGGYIRLTSTVPVIGQEIFGTFDLRLQSAVPPTWIR